ncbi:MAG TPA: nitroreductase [Flavobacteriales bacterium]|jgi:nitroreductase|nr:nitroreductase [Flavobacteriales bacterium]HAW20809.1 nitroreductase [Flavobacteriales bacterium]
MQLTAAESRAWMKTRRSVYPKMFKNGEVSREEILRLLEVARWAPTHKLTQPWRFHVYMNESRLELAKLQSEILINQKGESEQTVAKCAKMHLNADRSAAVIAIIMKRDVEKRVPPNEEICAVACAVQNIALHASSMGLGGYWSTGASTNSPKIRSELKLNEDDLHLGWLYIGAVESLTAAKDNRFEVEGYVEFR